MSKVIKQFRKKVLPFLSDWRSIDLRIVAYHFQDVWFFNAVRAILDLTSPSESTRKDLPKIANLLVAHERWDIARIDELLASISKGEIVVGKDIVHIKRFDGQNMKPIPHPQFRFKNRKDCKSTFGTDYASFVLEEYESSRIPYEEEEIIDHQLRSSPKPWDGLSFSQHLLRFAGICVDHPRFLYLLPSLFD